ncbi:hypothetical protein G7054_g13841 [Neopestalotiopsis clavispora]|nr:hypothetical protein G7054_g13841 [Neopestalotiopsis clavispora]
MMSNVSESLTHLLRKNGHANYSAAVLGHAQHYATCIEVRWGWIALPAVLTLLTLVLLICVIVTANAEQEPVWKDSPLVWIIRGVKEFKSGGNHMGNTVISMT